MERARTPADGIIGRRVSPLHGNTREREEGVACRGGAAEWGECCLLGPIPAGTLALPFPRRGTVTKLLNLFCAPWLSYL